MVTFSSVQCQSRNLGLRNVLLARSVDCIITRMLYAIEGDRAVRCIYMHKRRRCSLHSSPLLLLLHAIKPRYKLVNLTYMGNSRFLMYERRTGDCIDYITLQSPTKRLFPGCMNSPPR